MGLPNWTSVILQYIFSNVFLIAAKLPQHCGCIQRKKECISTLRNRLSLSTRKLIFTVKDARLTITAHCCCQQRYHTIARIGLNWRARLLNHPYIQGTASSHQLRTETEAIAKHLGCFVKEEKDEEREEEEEEEGAAMT